MELVVPPRCLAAGKRFLAKIKKESKYGPETVLITYRVKPGNESEFEQVLAQAWTIYRQERLVHAWPHIVVRDIARAKAKRASLRFSPGWITMLLTTLPKSVKDIWD